MKLQFESNQPYQLTAVQSVIEVFEGQPLAKGNFEISFPAEKTSIALTERGIGNNLLISEQQILDNVKSIQVKNGIQVSKKLISVESSDGQVTFGRLNFTVEMETGTGKTYTYLRSIYELNKVYGFKKFVIVVPSVPIREGVIKNLQITHEHFQSLYRNPSINFVQYESKNPATLRNFSMSNALQILVINIDSFAKDSNIINTRKETGIKPIEYIKATNPIVIIDEPQNVETDVRKAAIHNLNPLCTLRFSATHRNIYNLVYSLNPVQAYDLGLVKQIEVDGITSDGDYNTAFIHFKGLQVGKKSLKAKLGIYVNENGSVKSKDFSVGLGDDLYTLSNGRDTYKDGFLLNSIRSAEAEIEFSNGLVLAEGVKQGGLTDEVMKFQIERTIKWHLDKVKKLGPKGIKVLSLFFIDKVANYRQYDSDGNPLKGKFALWFEESFDSLSRQAPYSGLINFNVDELHDGYFSKDKQGKKNVWVDSKEKNTLKDDDTYSLIMKDKERLLSLDEPLQFIFSHTALREGWDNPNVFQICTLNESKSEIKKRQEIGRGLRLPVNNFGHRIHDKQVNVLTVVSNETYESFSRALQKEIQDETNVDFKDRIKDARNKAQIKLSKELTIENYPLLFDIWKRISQKTRFRVAYSSEELVTRAVAEIKDLNRVPLTKGPILESRTALIKYTEHGVEGNLQTVSLKKAEQLKYSIPDVYTYIQNRVDVTRRTIFQILEKSDRYTELMINPQMYLDNVIAAIQRSLNSLLVEGVKYEQIAGKYYEVSLFNNEEIETYLSNLFKVTKPEKTLFNFIRIQSNIESEFARDCDADENVKFFFKLPGNFKVPTPLGAYTPDWAVVFQNDKRIYFVAETKGTLNSQLLRQMETMKIECGSRHFALLKPLGVEYKLAVKVKDLH